MMLYSDIGITLCLLRSNVESFVIISVVLI